MDVGEPIFDVEVALDHLQRGDDTRKYLLLIGTNYTDAELDRLVEALVASPNVFTHVVLNSNRLSDVTGSKLACYVASSTSLVLLEIRDNDFSDSTLVAIARAARITGSLRHFLADASSTHFKKELRRELGELHSKPGLDWWIVGPCHLSEKL